MTETFSNLSPIPALLTSIAGPPITRLFRLAGINVLALPNRYSMTSLVFSPDGIMVVDVGSIDDIPRIFTTIRLMGREPDQISYVVPSHFHFDHIMGVDTLAGMVGARILLGPVQRQVVAKARKLTFPMGLALLRPLIT